MRIALRPPGAVLAQRARSGGWWARAEATRRDLVMVLRDLRGQHPPPLVARAGPSRGAAVPAGPAAPPTLRPDERAAPEAHRVTILRGGGQVEVVVPAGRTILEACLAVGLAMEFSCGMGGCGTCRVRLESGAVELDTPNCLTPEERARGLVLACVARPRGPCTIAGRR